MMKPVVAEEVRRWLGRHSESEFRTTAEILYGIELLPEGKRRIGLEAAARTMFDRVFAGRVLPLLTLRKIQ
jgi:toxin FitB